MKRLCALALSVSALSNAVAQTNVGVTIGINQPGVYGEITFGNMPPPRVINQRPIVIVQSPVREPLYLYVPPGHQKRWSKHCEAYNACGRPVYFVREDWVREQSAGRHDAGGRGGDKKHDRGNHGKAKKKDD